MKSRLCTKLSIDVSKRDDSPNFKQLNELTRCALIGDGRAMYEIGLKYLKGDDGFTQDQDAGVKWIRNASNAKYKLTQSMIADLYSKGDSIEKAYYKANIWYKTLSKKKDLAAQCSVGIMYKIGHGVRKDPLEASKWFTWAADQGNSDAQYNLGMLRLYGIGLRQDTEEAIELFFKSTNQRNTHASSIVGDIYLYSRYGVERSSKRGLKLLEFAAKNGSIYAQAYLGRYYSDTKTEHHDLSKSILYYTMAVDPGNITASYNLAIIYLNGNDTPKDYIKIYSLFKQSGVREGSETLMSISASIKDYSEILNMFIDVTNSGIDDLYYRIGNLYENGVQRYGKCIFDPDYTNAIKWYAVASSKGDSRADYRLGVMHECGKYFKRDTATAITYYNKASISGDTDAIYRLACMYINGYGVTQDLLRAFQLFTRASTLGHKNANKQFKVERVYESDELNHSHSLTPDPEIEVNKKTRIRMLEKVTKKGYARLQYQLGIMYEKDQDSQGAFKWFSFAVNIGVTDAYYRVGVFYEEGRGVDQDYIMAAKMYQKAIEEHEDAYYRLGQLYQYGNGVDLDYLKSYQFYKKASDMGHVEAHRILIQKKTCSILHHKNIRILS
jgi:TPR repeat protein